MKTILAMLVISGAYITCAMGIERYVSPPGGYGTNNPPYTSWADAATNIQWAVDASSDGDTIWVTNGTYNLTNQITIIRAITLKSVNGTNTTFINGNYPAYTNRCFYITNAAVVEGLTISNGFYLGGTDDGGGGVFLRKYGLVTNCVIIWNMVSNDYAFSGGGGAFLYQGGTLAHCAIVSNTALNSAAVGYNRMGGGVYALNAGMITGCSLIGNVAQVNGGGAFIYNGGTAVCCVIAGNRTVAAEGGGIVPFTAGSKVLNCVIKQNYSPSQGGGVQVAGNGLLADSIVSNNLAGGMGGGIYMNYGGTVSNCTISDNVAANAAGGIYCEGDWGFYKVFNCIVKNNGAVQSGGGGGIYARNGGLIRNCAVYGNTNRNNGGGIYFNNNASTNNSAPAGLSTGLVNCTVSSNMTGTLGGGIHAIGLSNLIENCIVFSNVATGDTYDELYHADPYNTNNYWYTCVPVALAPNQGNITNDPLFAAPAENNYRPSKNSPCVDAGTNRDWMANAVDLDGQRRIDGFSDRVDMGCYEYMFQGSMCNFR